MGGMSNQRCLRCHGDRFQTGTIQSMGGMHFLPDTPRLKYAFGFGAVTVIPRLCLDCGTVDLTVDAGDVEELAAERASESGG